MKVFISPQFSGKDTAQGGIRRVWEAQHKYFPELGIEIVPSPMQADLAACHATEFVDHDVVVAHNHGLYWAGYDWASWAIKANQKLVEIIKQAKVVTTPSEWVANSMRRGMLIDPIVCPHGVEFEDWEPLPKRDFVLWAKTRPDPICDPNEMNRLAALAHGVPFLATFGTKTDNVNTIGALPFDQIKAFIQSATIYLATVRETGGITVLEAMASGTIPLGWNWGANAEIIEHKVTGYLAEPGNYQDLFEGLLYCRANQKELSVNTRQAVQEQFQWKHVIHRYREAYEIALEGQKQGPAVSVIVTAYNLAQYLPACLRSIISQDFDDWECIVVDDASPDDCGRIADDFAREDPRIRVIHNKNNAYLAEARNIAIRASHGNYILPLDADDKLGAGALKLLSRALDNNRQLDIVTGSMQVVEEDGITPWSQLERTGGISGWPTSHPNFNEQIRSHNQVPYASMYRRRIWEQTGGYRRRYKTAEDADFWTRVMSFGAVPAKVTENPTLIYTNRESSMSHKEGAINWTDWFIWAKYPDLTPYGASGDPPNNELCWDIHPYGPVEVSVVIPCGPGHDWYLQDALDSLMAQTFLNWECIIVNDTGKPWFDGEKLSNPYIQGFPWARIIDSEGPSKGVAWARTTGTQAARGALVFYLDADDFLQPAALDVLTKVQHEYGGWVYSDWYDQNLERKYAQEWSPEGLVSKMLGPMTGLYPRDAMLAVMFEDFGGWEDWDAQLSLLERGICGTYVNYPTFVYRYHTGTRREDNYGKAEDLLQYIRNKHRKIYTEEGMAGCKTCGGGGGKRNIKIGTSRVSRAAAQQETEMVLIEYVGPATQFQRLKSRVKASVKYRFGGNPGADSRKFYVYKTDSQWMLQNSHFRRVPNEVQAEAVTKELPVLEANTRPVPIDFDRFFEDHNPPASPKTTPVVRLSLAPEVISILEAAGLMNAEDIEPMSIAQLVTIKGIGPKRAAQIIEAVKELLG